ncbi:MAG: VWA domain-containing protein, partial [Bacilli bacterium]|nr:VWA domain-containing protein [Bacilli bacterium]
EYNIDLDSDEDLDFDGLTNKQEKEYGTNPILADTDMDGLDDYYEIFTSKTDPTKADTDEDGLNDYDEIEMQLDPLKSDSKGDGVKDGDRTLSFEYSNDEVSLSVNGKGNIASSIVNVNKDTKISTKTGMINKLYSVYSEGEVNDLTISISYTDEELVANDIIEDNLTIYAYKSDIAEYEKVKTEIDKNQKKVKAKAKKGENYVVGDSSKIKLKSTSQILFVLDNSWSMYSNEQYKEITGEDYTGNLDGFDKEGARFTLTSDLIDKLSSKGHSIGISEFRSDYANISKIGTSKGTLKKNLNNMYGKFATNVAGTNIRTALENGMKEFDKESDNKYIIILTDGQDSGLKSSAEKIINKANEENVNICSIGFGGGSLNVELSNISNATGCKFFSSSDSNGLTELFDNVETELSDDLVDVDNDGESDAILIADSGFIVNRDGFSFKNYGSDLSNGGHCYGMATFAELYYLKKLPLNVSEITVGEDKSYAYDLRNTYFKKYDNLYSYNLKTNELKYQFGFELFGEEIPEDYRILDDDVLTFGKDYLKEINDSGIYELNKTESGLSSDAQIEKYGFTY